VATDPSSAGSICGLLSVCVIGETPGFNKQLLLYVIWWEEIDFETLLRVVSFYMWLRYKTMRYCLRAVWYCRISFFIFWRNDCVSA
jgi:hypothetical protein